MPVLLDVNKDEDEDGNEEEEEDLDLQLGGSLDPILNGAETPPEPPIPENNPPHPPQLHREYCRPYVEDYASDKEDERENDEWVLPDSDDEGSSSEDDEEEGLDSWEGISLAFKRELADFGG